MSATIVRKLHRHERCGSTALRNLLAFDGIEITEEMALGLGAGVCFYYVPMDNTVAVALHQWARQRLEEQFCELTGADLEFDTYDDAERSWEAARAAVDAGRPPYLLHQPLLPRPLRPVGALPRARGDPRRLRRRGRLPLRYGL